MNMRRCNELLVCVCWCVCVCVLVCMLAYSSSSNVELIQHVAEICLTSKSSSLSFQGESTDVCKVNESEQSPSNYLQIRAKFSESFHALVAIPGES